MAALFLRGELIFEMHSRRAGLDHRLHQLEHVQRSAESRFRIGDNRREPVGAVAPFRVRDLVGALQRAIDPPHGGGHAVDRVQALVGIRVTGGVAVGRDLPPRQIDRIQTGTDHLYCLASGQCAEGADRVARLEQGPELPSAAIGDCVLNPQGAPQPFHIVGGVGTSDPFPARILLRARPDDDIVKSRVWDRHLFRLPILEALFSGPRARRRGVRGYPSFSPWLRANSNEGPGERKRKRSAPAGMARTTQTIPLGIRSRYAGLGRESSERNRQIGQRRGCHFTV